MKVKELIDVLSRVNPGLDIQFREGSPEINSIRVTDSCVWLAETLLDKCPQKEQMNQTEIHITNSPSEYARKYFLNKEAKRAKT